MRAPPKPAAKANFGGVTTQVDSTERGRAKTPLESTSLMDSLRTDTDYFQQLDRVKALRQQQDASGETERMRAASQKRSFQSLNPAVRGLIGAGSRVNRLVEGAGQVLGLQSDEGVQQSRRAEQAMEGDLAAGVGGFVGDIGMLAAPGGAVAKLPGAARYMGGALIGGSYGALQPVLGGESRTVNTAIGAGLGAGGEALSTGVRAFGTRAANAIAPETRVLLDKAKAAGIRITPAQLAESPALKSIRSTVGRLPFSGAAKVGKQQQAQFNRAVGRTFGEEADAITPEVYAAAKKRIGGQFNDISARNSLPVDDSLLDGLIGVQREAAEFGDEATAKAVNSAIERVMN